MKRWLGRAVGLGSLAIVAAACGSGSPTLVVDGFEFGDEDFDALHDDVDELDADERAGTGVLLILRHAFAARAESELGIGLNAADVDSKYQERLAAFDGRGGAEQVLGAMNQTVDRVRIDAELDVLSDSVGEELVRSEAPGFDIEEAYQEYLLANAEVCIRQIQLAEGTDFAIAVDRLEVGEAFDSVARDMSLDPFVDRTEGVGAGGEIGCSAPNALPGGLDIATLEANVDAPFGPVTSDIGLHLLVVYDRTAPDLTEVRAEVIDFAVPQQGPTLFRDWAVGVLQTIDVEVDSSIGRWGMLPETDPVSTIVPPYRLSDIIE